MVIFAYENWYNLLYVQYTLLKVFFQGIYLEHIFITHVKYFNYIILFSIIHLFNWSSLIDQGKDLGDVFQVTFKIEKLTLPYSFLLHSTYKKKTKFSQALSFGKLFKE